MSLFSWFSDNVRITELEKQVDRLVRDRDIVISERKWARSDAEMYKSLLRDHERAFRKRNKHIKRLQRRLQDERQRRVLAESLLEGKDKLLSDIFKKRTDD